MSIRSGSTRTRRRTDRERPVRTAVAGLTVLAVLGLLVYVIVQVPNGAPLLAYKTMYADVRDPGNLQPHSEVRIDGVRVGQVIDTTSHAGGARIKFKLDPGADAPPADSSVFVRAKGLLGARYLELRPGKSSKPLEDGDTVRGGPNALSLGVPEALSTFDRETRGALGEMAEELGRGLLARSNDVNDALRTSPVGARDFVGLVDEVLDRPGAARRLVPSLDQAAAAFDDAREELAQMLASTARGLQPFRDHRAAVRAMLDEAPGTLGDAQSGLGEGRRLLTAAQALSHAAATTLPHAPRGLDATTALLRESPVPLRRASALLEELRPTVPNVLRVTRGLSPNLDPLQRAFADLQGLSSDLAPASCDFENLADNLRSMIGWAQGPGGPVGPLNGFRAEAVFGQEALGPVASLPESAEAGYAYEPYPARCKYSPGAKYDESPLPASGAGR